jgi:hypothetical protein
MRGGAELNSLQILLDWHNCQHEPTCGTRFRLHDDRRYLGACTGRRDRCAFGLLLLLRRIRANVFCKLVLKLAVYRNDGSRIDFMGPHYSLVGTDGRFINGFQETPCNHEQRPRTVAVDSPHPTSNPRPRMCATAHNVALSREPIMRRPRTAPIRPIQKSSLVDVEGAVERATGGVRVASVPPIKSTNRHAITSDESCRRRTARAAQ